MNRIKSYLRMKHEMNLMREFDKIYEELKNNERLKWYPDYVSGKDELEDKCFDYEMKIFDLKQEIFDIQNKIIDLISAEDLVEYCDLTTEERNEKLVKRLMDLESAIGFLQDEIIEKWRKETEES